MELWFDIKELVVLFGPVAPISFFLRRRKARILARYGFGQNRFPVREGHP